MQSFKCMNLIHFLHELITITLAKVEIYTAEYYLAYLLGGALSAPKLLHSEYIFQEKKWSRWTLLVTLGKGDGSMDGDVAGLSILKQFLT